MTEPKKVIFLINCTFLCLSKENYEKKRHPAVNPSRSAKKLEDQEK